MARALTSEEIEVAKTLKRAWRAKKSNDESYSQEKLGERMALSQGSVSQYLNGTRAIGLELLMRLCTELEVDILDVYPGNLMQGKIKNTAQAMEFLTLFLKADEGIQNGVLTILRNTNPPS